MALNLINVGNIKNNLIKRLKNDFISLRFIGMSDDSERLTYISPLVTDGWSYYPDLDAPNGQVTEALKISNTSVIAGYLDKAIAVQLNYSDGKFERFTFSILNIPKPVLYEWLIKIEPNKADQAIIM